MRVPYLPTIVLAALGLLVLGVLLIRTFGALRRFTAMSTVVRTGVHGDLDRLRARRAALGVAFAQQKAEWRAWRAARREAKLDHEQARQPGYH